MFALASRPQIDDATVALVVDPFAERLGFEWRSWGVDSDTLKRETLEASVPDDEDEDPETDFQDIYVSDEHLFSLGAEIMHGTGYLSFPVSNGLVNYEEYYALSDDEFERFRADPEQSLPLLEQCRRREWDDRLMQQPGSNRGTPV